MIHKLRDVTRGGRGLALALGWLMLKQPALFMGPSSIGPPTQA